MRALAITEMLTAKGIVGGSRYTTAATLRRADRVDTSRRTVSSGIGACIDRGGEVQAGGGIDASANLQAWPC